MYVNSGILAIMNDNDTLQTKYIVGLGIGIQTGSLSNGDLVHIVIDDVTKNMGTEYNDAQMGEEITVRVNDKSYSRAQGTWTSTIEPENVTVELDCVVVKNDGTIVTAECGPDQWPESVFNRIPISTYGGDAMFGWGSAINRVLFGTNSFSTDGSIPSSWNESIRYDVSGSGSDLTIGDQFTIIGLPESFVNHWENMGAKGLMGKGYAMLVPSD